MEPSELRGSFAPVDRRAVELLRSGDHQGWKALRAEDPSWTPSFFGVDLTNLSLRSNDLENGWDLSHCKFDKADLSKSRIVRANLTGASFRGADLSEADLGYSVLIDCDFEDARMARVDLRGAVTHQTVLEPAVAACLLCCADARVEHHGPDVTLTCARCGRYGAARAHLQDVLLGRTALHDVQLDRTASTLALDLGDFAKAQSSARNPVFLDRCPFCAQQRCRARLENSFTAACRSCGLYEFPESAREFASLDEPSLRKICWRLRERFDEQVLARIEPRPVRIDPKLLDDVSRSVRAPDDPLDCLRLLVGWIQARSQPDGQYVGLRDVDFAIAHASSPAAMSYLLEQAAGLGWIEHQTNEGWRLTLDGWKQALEWRRKKPDARQVFVAMSFDRRYEPAWKALDAAIREVGLIPMRVDQLEHNDKICDRLMAEIRRSGLVIADCSHGSGNVYFEAGFALGLGLTVIWTCQESEKDGLKFDTRQYAHILWSDPADLANKIVNRLNATILPLE